MTKSIITANWETSMADAHALMKKSKIRHLPVTDDEGSLIGILSDRDVARAMKSTISIDDSSPGLYVEADEFDPLDRVRHYMSWPVKTVSRFTEVGAVAAEMIKHKISAVMVVEGDAMQGIITTEDLLKLLVDMPSKAEKHFDLNSIIHALVGEKLT
ncbi:MAG: HPP family protein [Bacteriovoracia bacterium]